MFPPADTATRHSPRAQQALDRLKATLGAQEERAEGPVRRCLEDEALFQALWRAFSPTASPSAPCRAQDAGFNPNEPRDRVGKWTTGGGTSKAGRTPAPPSLPAWLGHAGPAETQQEGMLTQAAYTLPANIIPASDHPSSAPFAYHITGHRKHPEPAQSLPDPSQQFSAHNLSVAAEDTV